jgi:hypothetical protein
VSSRLPKNRCPTAPALREPPHNVQSLAGTAPVSPLVLPLLLIIPLLLLLSLVLLKHGIAALVSPLHLTLPILVYVLLLLLLLLLLPMPTVTNTL